MGEDVKLFVAKISRTFYIKIHQKHHLAITARAFKRLSKILCSIVSSMNPPRETKLQPADGK